MSALNYNKIIGFGVEHSNLDVPFDLTHMSPVIGTLISGVDLRDDLSDEVIDGIRRVLVDRKVVFFRDQDISLEQHLAFSRRFGALEVHPFAAHKPGQPEVLAIEHDEKSKGRENGWHSDVTWRLEPSLGSVLRAVEVPNIGGDTLFSCMERAYEDLPDDIKARIDNKIAVHDFTHFRTRMKNQGKSEKEIAEFNEKYPQPEHPVVRTHPESGRKSLYVNGAFTVRILGMEEDESARLLNYLFGRASYPEYQCRFAWEKNSIAFWDNRSCQHYAASDYWPAVRKMERVTIVGDAPA